MSAPGVEARHGPRGSLRSRLRSALSLAFALVLLAFLWWRVPTAHLWRAWGDGPYGPLALYVLFELVAGLVVDAWAGRIALAAAGVRRAFAEIFWVRGGTYLLALLNQLLGLGGLGVYLARTGTPASAAAGAAVLVMVTQGLALLVLTAAALPLAPFLPPAVVGGLLVLGAAGATVYAVVLRRRAWLRHWPMVDTLRRAGWRGHVGAVASRLVHLMVLVALHWGAFRVWGIPVSPRAALAWMPLILLVATLPITPGGLGTTQALQVAAFSPFVAAAQTGQREAEVFAFSLAHQGLALLMQALVALACVPRVRHWLRRRGDE